MNSPSFDAIIHPYRSLGPRGLRAIFIVLIAMNAAAALLLLFLGGWPVLPFMGLDVLAVYVAFRISYDQARAYERVTINGEKLVVEQVDRKGGRKAFEFPSYWVSVWFEGDDEQATVTLRSHGRALVVGSYLAPFEREAFANALRKALGETKALPPASQT